MNSINASLLDILFKSKCNHNREVLKSTILLPERLVSIYNPNWKDTLQFCNFNISVNNETIKKGMMNFIKEDLSAFLLFVHTCTILYSGFI